MDSTLAVQQYIQQVIFFCSYVIGVFEPFEFFVVIHSFTDSVVLSSNPE